MEGPRRCAEPWRRKNGGTSTRSSGPRGGGEDQRWAYSLGPSLRSVLCSCFMASSSSFQSSSSHPYRYICLEEAESKASMRMGHGFIWERWALEAPGIVHHTCMRSHSHPGSVNSCCSSPFLDAACCSFLEMLARLPQHGPAQCLHGLINNQHTYHTKTLHIVHFAFPVMLMVPHE
jgi:hypothetical protein